MSHADLEAIEGIEGVLDELLALPPERFTAARNTAAKQLRADGRRDAADTVKSLPRPPVSLWALNRLAHEQPSLVDAFLAAADQLREAYRSGGDIRAATVPERAAEARVVDAASELARSAGLNVTDAVSERLRQTVHAAAAGAETADALRAGRLIREPEAPSLDALLGSLPPPAAAPPQAVRLALQERIAEAEQAAEDARGAERAAAGVASEARKAWERAQERAEDASRRSEAAAERLRDLQGQLEKL